ncbi:hypothetical protein PG993_013582 [Apiospora rasikravindrae]|uniref:Uncharacterized protein n=1 Tax=Apiospora rasikravindrae TaxID=990691 RepID=A0ABR1RY14_9PEZI
MHTPEAHSLASTNDEASQNGIGYRSPATLISLQGSQRTPPHEPEPDAYGIALVNERRSKIPSQQPPGLWSQWWVEILNCLLMIATLCAMIGVLYPNNRKPLPDLPYQVSINTIVSILSTALKASTALVLAEGISHLKWDWFQVYRLLNNLDIFDKASRGPLGCLQLLVALAQRGRQFAPILAAALTILTLALDPFYSAACSLLQLQESQHGSPSHTSQG